MADKQLNPLEALKDKSNYLYGSILEDLEDPLTGSVHDETQQLTKFHGTYQQDDRDIRLRRMAKRLEPAYRFMIRICVPGGICSAEQWIAMDDLADGNLADPTLKLTTRQAFQLHGVLKRNLWETMNRINKALMTTLAACGDVCRNVMCNPNPYVSAVHQEVYQWTKKINDHVAPRTNAYHQIWVNREKVIDTRSPEEIEPIYGKSYLPRKFKIGLIIPPNNDIDVFTQDLGYIAIEEDGKLAGFNIVCGGGMGTTHGVPETYPRLGDVIGFCKPEQVLEVTENIVKIQRDFGDRTNRKHARFKYTIDDRGVDWLVSELNSRLGWDIEPARQFILTKNGDQYGWFKGIDGKWHLTLFIEHGRVKDTDNYPLKTGLRKVAELGICDFRLTGNQGLILGDIDESDKAQLEEVLQQHGLLQKLNVSGARKNSIACAALPYCALSMAEAERYLPSLIDRIDPILQDCGLWDDPIVVRMTGCPNGCGRPFMGEIGFIGKSMGHYNVYLGAGFAGDRLNKLWKESLTEDQIIAELEPIIRHYAKDREHGEKFGDFVIRNGYIKATIAGKDFHDR